MGKGATGKIILFYYIYMKENKSYQNLQDIIENEPLEIEPIREKIKVNCSDKVEVFFNSFLVLYFYY